MLKPRDQALSVGLMKYLIELVYFGCEVVGLNFFGIIGILDGEGYCVWTWRMACKALDFTSTAPTTLLTLF